MSLFIYICLAIMLLLLYLIGCKLLTEDTMQFGELDVTAKNTVEVPLRKRPEKSLVEFIGDVCWVPCNPQGFDQLAWRLVSRKVGVFGKRKWFLEISWEVTGVRKIYWEVSF